MGRTRLKTLRLPPHIRYSVPWRAWVMLEAMQPSSEEFGTDCGGAFFDLDVDRR